MASHSSATARVKTPHVTQTSRTNTIINVLKQRAQKVLNDRSLDPQVRATVRYALERNDPWLAELVRRADAGESIVETMESSERPEPDENILSRGNIEALTEIICGAGAEAAAALLVLMGTLQNSTEPKALAHMVKHLAFTRCGELNVYDMVDAQIAVLEGELLGNTPRNYSS